MITTIKISDKTRDALASLKKTEKSSYEDVLKGLLPEGVNLENYTTINKEAPAWEWIVGFSQAHTPDETLTVSWSELKESELGDSWALEGSWDTYEATIIYKDSKGVLVRMGEQRYDDPEIEYFLEYFQFL